MGINNRAKRAAKKRKRSRYEPSSHGSSSHGSSSHGSSSHERSIYDPIGVDGDGGFGGLGEPPLGDLLVVEAIGCLQREEATAADLADSLLMPGGPGGVRPAEIVRAMRRDLTMATAAAGAGGWTPHDLAELVDRRLSSAHLPLLAHLLTEEVRRHRAETVSAQWREEITALGRRADVPLETVEGLALALGLSAVVGAVPVIPRLLPPPGQADPLAAAQQRVGRDGPGAKVLARVRGLLAKAESTEFPEEAEALSTKAQELISRYSLDALLATSAGDHTTGQAPIRSRRLWIDAPYVGPKAHLVHHVARANRCSTVLAEALGFTTVVGTAADLDAVELLTTSLMVQADTAMLAAGRQVDRYGGSRTASYRRAFLLAYATRIGQRLTEARDAAVSTASESDGGGALVPLLRRQGERVDATVAELFPHTVAKRVNISNIKGWAEGTAAADAARLDAQRSIG